MFPKKLVEPEFKTCLKAIFLFGIIYFAFDHCALEICVLHEQNVGINDNAFVKRQYFNWFPAIWTVSPTIDFIASVDELR